jgi:DNA-binding NtrC family response regulator
MRNAGARGTVLYVEDSSHAREEIAAYLREEGFHVQEAVSAEEALLIAEAREADVALIDLTLPHMDGLTLIRRLRHGWAGNAPWEVTVIVLTGAGTIERAFEAGQLRVFAFLQKPVTDPDDLVRLLDEAVQHTWHAAPPSQPNEAAMGMIGSSAAIETVRDAVARVAPTSARVLITGESGTGKELVARAIHALSPRCSAPFVEVNCASIPRELVESELFGHERGAFTGATATKAGRLELAHGGTLFLDEVGDMSPAAQATLLRTIETGHVLRVGATRPLTVDVRILAATNKLLEDEVQAGRFREDLYYRLNVLRIHVPPLRERRVDIPPLAEHFLRQSAATYGRPSVILREDAAEALATLDWPGNVRELKNAIERLVILCDGPAIGAEDVRRAYQSVRISQPSPDAPALKEEMWRREEQVILDELQRTGWNVSESARRLGIARASLHRKIKEHGLERERADQ